jgi:hypothetical protein
VNVALLSSLKQHRSSRSRRSLPTSSSGNTTPTPLRATSLPASLNSPIFIQLRTLWHSGKCQPLCNQANTNSFAKTPGWGVPGANAPSLRALSLGYFRPFVFIALRIAFSATPLLPQRSALPWGVFRPASQLSAIDCQLPRKSFIYRFYAKRPGCGGPPVKVVWLRRGWSPV